VLILQVGHVTDIIRQLGFNCLDYCNAVVSGVYATQLSERLLMRSVACVDVGDTFRPDPIYNGRRHFVACCSRSCCYWLFLTFWPFNVAALFFFILLIVLFCTVTNTCSPAFRSNL